ncbi:hypothetical protein [Microbacterium suaedae]|uniref:hypothetical protein n=1 Tax=Microbacterium suaedae TaxID=2067813 RepID=UPI0013A65995|nr:hypothetical protein [Microbacterium suaedae]
MLANRSVDEYIGAQLSSLADDTDRLAGDVVPDTTYMVQDASPRIGEPPMFDGDDALWGEWTIVNACSDGDTLEDSTVIEVAVIPADHDIDEADFSDAVACEWDWIGDD